MFRILLFIFCVALVAPVGAFELTVFGVQEHQWNYISRGGPGDLFGLVTAAQQGTGTTTGGQGGGNTALSTIGLSGPHGGIVTPEGFSSKAADGSYALQRLLLSSLLRVTPAVSVHGEVAFQGNLNGTYTGGPNWSNPSHYAGWIFSGARPDDGNNSYAVPILRTLWSEFITPWGATRIGRQPFAFGVGWSGFHAGDYRPSSLVQSVPYGPLSFLWVQGFGMTGTHTDPFDSRAQNKTPFAISTAYDRNIQQEVDTGLGFTYRAGSLDCGGLWRLVKYGRIHATPMTSGPTIRDDVSGWPLAALAAAGTTSTQNNNNAVFPYYADAALQTLVLYTRYSNARMFLNIEYTQQWLQFYRSGARPISGEPIAWFLETGALAGPLKATFVAASRSGHRRDGGELNFTRATGGATTGAGNQATAQVSDKWEQFILPGGGQEPLMPYGYLFGLYGAGNNAYDASGYPTYLDTVVAALRLDYAVASNLNTYATALYASRQSNASSWWGEYGGGAIPGKLTGPNVPDTALGWEFGLGLDWQLLDKMLFKARLAYWQPGRWFNHAYVNLADDFTVTPGGTTGTQDSVRIRPGRGIDPLFGFQLATQIDF